MINNPNIQNPYAFNYSNYGFNGYNYQPVNQQNAEDIQWVQGEAGAKAYVVPAGHKAWLMDSENPCFYIKETDATGMPLPLRIFDFVERKEASKAQDQPQVDLSQYVKKSELADYIRNILTDTAPVGRHGGGNESNLQSTTE